MFELRSHPEADEEVEETIAYLSERTLHQATRFADHLHDAFSNIRSHPERHHFIHREFRRCHLKRFPFSIIYRQQHREIFVIALMHDKRHPDYWKHRIPSTPTLE